MKAFFLSATILLLISCGGQDQQKVNTATTQAAVAGTTPQVAVAEPIADSARVDYVCPPCPCNMHDSVWHHPGVCPACHMPLVRKLPAKK